MGEPPAQVIVSREEGGLVPVGGVPPDPAAHKVNKVGTHRAVTQQQFFSFLTSLTSIRVLTLTTEWIHTVE